MTPSPTARPCTNVVFPAPSGPVRTTTSPPTSWLPSARASARVAATVEQSTCTWARSGPGAGPATLPGSGPAAGSGTLTSSRTALDLLPAPALPGGLLALPGVAPDEAVDGLRRPASSPRRRRRRPPGRRGRPWRRAQTRSRTCPDTTSGCSSITRCPACRTTTCSAPGSDRTMASECRGGVIRSRSPTSTQRLHLLHDRQGVLLVVLGEPGQEVADDLQEVSAMIRATKRVSSGGTGEAKDHRRTMSRSTSATMRRPRRTSCGWRASSASRLGATRVTAPPPGRPKSSVDRSPALVATRPTPSTLVPNSSGCRCARLIIVMPPMECPTRTTGPSGT